MTKTLQSKLKIAQHEPLTISGVELRCSRRLAVSIPLKQHVVLLATNYPFAKTHVAIALEIKPCDKHANNIL